MTLKIGDKKIDFYNELEVSLQYDSVASSFAFAFYFNPDNAAHRDIFQPGRYLPVTIEHDGELLITGTLLSCELSSGAVRELAKISGYSKSGVLEDCEIPTSAYPLHSKGLTLEQIARKVIQPFGLTMIVDVSVAGRADVAYKDSIAGDNQSVKQYLSELAGQRHVILTHDERGNVVMTEAKTTAAPVYHFEKGAPGAKMSLSFDGQRMHSGIELIKQQTKGRKDGSHKKGNAGQASASNPFVPAGVFRPKVNRQTSGENVNTADAARNMLSEELKGVSLKIELDRWTLGGKIVRPNSIITVLNPELYLYQKTAFFIAQVDFKGNSESETATLSCVLPSVFSSANPVNIFKP